MSGSLAALSVKEIDSDETNCADNAVRLLTGQRGLKLVAGSRRANALSSELSALPQTPLAFLLLRLLQEHLFVHSHFLHLAVFESVRLISHFLGLAFLLSVELSLKLLVALLYRLEFSWLYLVALSNAARLLIPARRLQVIVFVAHL